MTDGYPVKADGERLYGSDIENLVHIGISRHADNAELTANLPAAEDRPVGMLVYVEDPGIYMRWAGTTDLWQPAGLQKGRTTHYLDVPTPHTETTITTASRCVKVPLLTSETYLNGTRIEGLVSFSMTNSTASPQTVTFRSTWCSDNDVTGVVGVGTVGASGVPVLTYTDGDLGAFYNTHSYTIPAGQSLRPVLPVSVYLNTPESAQRYAGLHFYYYTETHPDVFVSLVDEFTRLRVYPERSTE